MATVATKLLRRMLVDNPVAANLGRRRDHTIKTLKYVLPLREWRSQPPQLMKYTTVDAAWINFAEATGDVDMLGVPMRGFGRTKRVPISLAQQMVGVLASGAAKDLAARGATAPATIRFLSKERHNLLDALVDQAGALTRTADGYVGAPNEVAAKVYAWLAEASSAPPSRATIPTESIVWYSQA